MTPHEINPDTRVTLRSGEHVYVLRPPDSIVRITNMSREEVTVGIEPPREFVMEEIGLPTPHRGA